MTKDELERIEKARRLALRRYEDSNEGGQMYYTLRDDMPLLFAALEEAWVEIAALQARATDLRRFLRDQGYRGGP